MVYYAKGRGAAANTSADASSLYLAKLLIYEKNSKIYSQLLSVDIKRV